MSIHTGFNNEEPTAAEMRRRARLERCYTLFVDTVQKVVNFNTTPGKTTGEVREHLKKVSGVLHRKFTQGEIDYALARFCSVKNRETKSEAMLVAPKSIT